MLENFTKILALITAIIPILHLLDRAKRFSHNRNFYKERTKAVKYYQDEIKKEGVSQLEKDCAAQFLACSNKIGSAEINYLIDKFPESFFEKLELLIKAKKIIKYKKTEIGGFEWTSKRNKNKLYVLLVKIVFTYFSSLVLLYINEILIFLFGFFEKFSPVYISNINYVIVKLFLILIALFIAFISLSLFQSVDATLKIYDDLEIKNVH